MHSHPEHDHPTLWLAVVVGGLIVLVAGLGYLIYDNAASSGREVSMAVNLPNAVPADLPPGPAPAPAPLPRPAGLIQAPTPAAGG